MEENISKTEAKRRINVWVVGVLAKAFQQVADAVYAGSAQGDKLEKEAWTRLNKIVPWLNSEVQVFAAVLDLATLNDVLTVKQAISQLESRISEIFLVGSVGEGHVVLRERTPTISELAQTLVDIYTNKFNEVIGVLDCHGIVTFTEDNRVCISDEENIPYPVGIPTPTRFGLYVKSLTNRLQE